MEGMGEETRFGINPLSGKLAFIVRNEEGADSVERQRIAQRKSDRLGNNRNRSNNNNNERQENTNKEYDNDVSGREPVVQMTENYKIPKVDFKFSFKNNKSINNDLSTFRKQVAGKGIVVEKCKKRFLLLSLENDEIASNMVMDKLDNEQTMEECIVDIFNSERQVSLFSKMMTDVEKARSENGESVLAFLQRLKELFLRLNEDVRESPYVRNSVNNKIKANLPGYLKRDFEDRFHEMENISPTVVFDVVLEWRFNNNSNNNYNNNNNNRNNNKCFNCG
eukprot:Awhi_evm2s4992